MCFGTEEALQTDGPELKTKLHDKFEAFFTSYHPLVVNQFSEVIFIKYGQGGALGLATYLRIGSNLEI